MASVIGDDQAYVRTPIVQAAGELLVEHRGC